MSHVVEMPIRTEKWEEDRIQTRFEAAKEAYNAVLGEYLKRVERAQDSLEMKKADKPSEVFRDYGVKFTRTMAQSIRRDVLESGCWIYNHLSANTLDSITERAADAVESWVYGPDGKPRFKTATPKNRMKTITSSNGFKLEDNDETLVWSTSRGGNEPLRLDIDVEPRDRLSLQDRSDYPQIAIKRKRIKGRWRFFCQVVCNGSPPMTANIEPAEGKKVGLDVGVLRVAYASEDELRMFRLGEELQDRWDEIKELDRKMDRQKRQNNPNRYKEDGTWDPEGEWADDWPSKGYVETRDKRRDIYRQYAEHRKRIHEKTANALLERGTEFVIETRRYKWAQEVGHGDKIRDNAPAQFIDILTYKAESVGGSVTETKDLSGECICGSVEDTKAVDFTCPVCGREVPRPALSAFLGRFYSDGELNRDAAKEVFDENELRQPTLKPPTE